MSICLGLAVFASVQQDGGLSRFEGVFPSSFPPSTILDSPRFSPLIRSNLSIYCCVSRTSSPSIPPDARRHDPDPGEHCSPRGSLPRLGPPTPRRPVCALCDPRPGPRPSRTFYAGLGVSAVKKAWPSLAGGMDVDKALPGRSPRPRHRPHSPPPSPLRWDPGP